MARKAREKSESGYYGILIGGKRGLFFDDEDYSVFIHRIHSVFGERIAAFALTEDTAALAVKESERGIGTDIRALCSGYTHYFKQKYIMDGALFTERFKSMTAESGDELARVLAQVHALCAVTGKDGYTGIYRGERLVIPDLAREFMGDERAYRAYRLNYEGTGLLDGIFKTLRPKTLTAATALAFKTAYSEPPQSADEPELTAVEYLDDELGAQTEALAVKKKKKIPSWLL